MAAPYRPPDEYAEFVREGKNISISLARDRFREDLSPPLLLLLSQDVLYKVWSSSNVLGGLGMDATDAYHAGSVRQQLIQQMNATLPEYGLTVPQLAQVSKPLEGLSGSSFTRSLHYGANNHRNLILP